MKISLTLINKLIEVFMDFGYIVGFFGILRTWIIPKKPTILI